MLTYNPFMASEDKHPDGTTPARDPAAERSTQDRNGHDRVIRLLLACFIFAVFLLGVLHPYIGRLSLLCVVMVFTVLGAGHAMGRLVFLRSIAERLDRHPVLCKVLFSAVSIVVLVGGTEWAAQIGVLTGRLTCAPPMLALVAPGTDDYRVMHYVTLAGAVEHDPVLMWRPIAGPPYNSQRFKGPEVKVPKPAGTVRIIAYGDSNTAGPPEGSWPECLQRVIERRVRTTNVTYEVMNAGVPGYSSHQGLLRLKEEIQRYRPDIILVSFGWNDLATTRGQPDREYRVPSGWRVALQRELLKYHFYLVTKHHLGRRQRKAAGRLRHRVSLTDYLGNMAQFSDVAAAYGAEAVFLTRPHRVSSPPGSSPGPAWLLRVPEFNRALAEQARNQNAKVIDAEGFFEGRHSLFVDRCHLSCRGHAQLAQMAYDKLCGWNLL